ncbi:amidohydrolase [Paenibacillus shirakamiensis]|uniref:Amidohydrolase n=1 Tax=Paenibacillus shirakamiensis TaxID=1265935 RepID=A0ABS4JGW6_9BACL|nr:M20 family metallopeptidase [Paenibacillus shirakamiensis]MBP2000957.1 amidohydrolase [Paenibacillus shirakamiensis]
MTNDRIWNLAQTLAEDLQHIRRHLHQYPELGFEEFITSAYVAEELTRIGLEVQTGIAGTGVVAILKGGQPGPVIAIRADMDALPLDEQTALDFQSLHEGKMHACGHDGHMAMALGAANILSTMREELSGTVKFIFQPAEEMLGGARHMITAGVLENPKVEAIVGLHVWPDLAVGQFGVRSGTIMASMDPVDITIIGQAGHGAAPHQGVDAVLISAHVMTALQSLISRESDPSEPVVLSMGSIHGGTLPNIIADRVELKGTVRSVHAITRERMALRIQALAEHVAEGMNAKAEVNYTFGYPPTVNNIELNTLAEETIESIWGIPAVVELKHSQMTSEDMAYYLEQIPGVFVLVGAGHPHEMNFPLHHPKLNIDEKALIYGATFLTAFAISALDRIGAQNNQETIHPEEDEVRIDS